MSTAGAASKVPQLLLDLYRVGGRHLLLLRWRLRDSLSGGLLPESLELGLDGGLAGSERLGDVHLCAH